ncbi:papain-like cysteine protease family protein [Bosea sp. (in: a-proteobacteria)]|uniref:papain-like cysteine protease family protein n=1 Tax=Bosea sp. (in: a-proteobacteria) TaxID=1871050 RepID=UPI002FC8DED8
MAGDLDLLIGKWTVKVKDWTWEYEFSQGGTAAWRDTRSPESGSGSWVANDKMVNIAWKDSTTRETWRRPLTPSNDQTWYESTYFRGRYKILKAATPGFAPPSPVILAEPPEIFQTSLYCWAAGAASWRRVKGRGSETVEDLVAQYGGYLNNDGSLPEGEPDDPTAQKGGMKTVFAKMGIGIQSIPRRDFTYDYVFEKLKTKGHFLLMATSFGDMGHTYVVYGVGRPSQEHFSAFDPLQNHGRTDKKFGELTGSSVYVGFGL